MHLLESKFIKMHLTQFNFIIHTISIYTTIMLTKYSLVITNYSFTQYQFVNFILHTIPIHNINTFKLAQANMYHNLIYVSISSRHSNSKKYLFNNYNKIIDKFNIKITKL